jgi:hypothetical protein
MTSLIASWVIVAGECSSIVQHTPLLTGPTTERERNSHRWSMSKFDVDNHLHSSVLIQNNCIVKEYSTKHLKRLRRLEVCIFLHNTVVPSEVCTKLKAAHYRTLCNHKIAKEFQAHYIRRVHSNTCSPSSPYSLEITYVNHPKIYYSKG